MWQHNALQSRALFDVCNEISGWKIAAINWKYHCFTMWNDCTMLFLLSSLAIKVSAQVYRLQKLASLLYRSISRSVFLSLSLSLTRFLSPPLSLSLPHSLFLSLSVSVTLTFIVHISYIQQNIANPTNVKHLKCAYFLCQNSNYIAISFRSSDKLARKWMCRYAKSSIIRSEAMK